MQAQTSILLPHTPTTLSAACLFSEASGNRSLSTGKQRDSESGNDYFGARYYASDAGRFLTPDPGGRKVVDLNAPQTWNMYAYVGGNPLSKIDPTGMNACSPNDKSTTDCKVTILIQDRPKDKNGNYDDQFTKVRNEKNYNASATVYVNGKPIAAYPIKTTPSSSKYGTVKAGKYSGTRKMHDNKYPAILLSSKRYGYGRVPALGGMDPHTSLPYLSGAEIHKSGYGNITGFYGAHLPISMGCSVIACSRYSSFESVTGLNAPAPQQDFTIILNTSANGGD